MKKTLAILLAALMLLGCLTACDSQTATDTPAASAANTGKTESPANSQVTITMVESLTSPERTQLLRGMADAYEAEHPNVKVEIISPAQESADAKIAQMLSSSDSVDIIEIRDHTLRTYVTNGWLVNLQDYIDKWDEADTLTNSALSAMRICDGEPYYMPFGFYERAMFIRKDIFADKGLSYPTTWDELVDTSAALTNVSSGTYGFSFRGVNGCYENANLAIYAAVGYDKIVDDNFAYFIDGNGTTIFTLPEAKEALIKFKELFQKGCPADSIAWGFSEQVQGFIGGTTAILFQDSDAVPTMTADLTDDQWTLVPLPTAASGDVCLPNGYGGWGLTTLSKNPDAAMDFILYLSSVENNTKFAENNGTLPIHSAAFSEGYFGSEQYQVYLTYGTDSKYHFVYPCMMYEAYSTYKSEVDEVYQKYLSDEITVDQLIEWLDSFWTEAFQTEGKLW